MSCIELVPCLYKFLFDNIAEISQILETFSEHVKDADAVPSLDTEIHNSFGRVRDGVAAEFDVGAARSILANVRRIGW